MRNSLGLVRRLRPFAQIAVSDLFRLHNFPSTLTFLSFINPLFLSDAGSPFPCTHAPPAFHTTNQYKICFFFRTSPAIPSILGNRARRMSFFSRKKHPSASQLAASNVTIAQTPSQALAQLGAKDPPQQSNDA